MPNKVKFTMSSIQSKITSHTEKRENTCRNKEVNKSIKTDPELTQMLGLADRTSKQILQLCSMCSKNKQNIQEDI